MGAFRNPGRVAGLYYLIIVVLGPLTLLYIPDKILVSGNAAATAANVAANEVLFRVGMLSDLVGGVVLVLLTLAFYRLFEGVDRNLAAMVVIFGGVMPALIDIIGVVPDFGVLYLARGADYLSAIAQPQRDSMALLLLTLGNRLNTAAEILWGVWLLPLAALVYRSRFMPRVLGIWLALGGIAYIVLCITGVMWPQYSGKVFAYAQPAFFGEVALMLWLLIVGAQPKPAEPATTA
jgi:uncharacterized protein DUF4386